MTASRRDRGQAVVELALTLPVVCILLLGVVQVGLVVRNQLAVQVAARAGARAAAVAADAHRAARDGAHGAISLRPLEVDVLDSTLRASADGPSSTTFATVTVTACYRDPTEVPVIGLLLPPVDLRATVTMAVEPP